MATLKRPGRPALAGWTKWPMVECASTNDEARDLPSWYAVMARRQTAGRGRFGRAWQSGDGGAWFSAVVPAPLANPWSALMPLAAGYAAARALEELGVRDARLRWPNDIMTPGGKCAGILVDRFHPDRCVVGIGINVENDPTSGDPQLAGQTTRLRDLLTPCPSTEEVIDASLRHLKLTASHLIERGPDALTLALRDFWKVPALAAVTIGGVIRQCQFWGVDARGHVLLKMEQGDMRGYAPEEIGLYREIEGVLS